MLTYAFFIFSKEYQWIYPHHKEYPLDEQYKFIKNSFDKFTISDYKIGAPFEESIRESIITFLENPDNQ